MIAFLIEELFKVFVEAAVVGSTGAGNQEHQGRRVILFGHAVSELFHRPEIGRQYVLTFRAQVEGVVRLVDIIFVGQQRAHLRRSGGNRSFKRIGYRVAIRCGVDIDRLRGRTQDKAAQ